MSILHETYNLSSDSFDSNNSRIAVFAALTHYVPSEDIEERRARLRAYNNADAFRCDAIRVSPHTLAAYARDDKTICVPPARHRAYKPGDRACVPTFSLENLASSSECLVVKREYGYWDDDDNFNPEVEIINKIPTADIYCDQVTKDGVKEVVHSPVSRTLFSYKSFVDKATHKYFIHAVETLPGAYVGEKGDFSINISNSMNFMDYRFNLEKVYSVLKLLNFVPSTDILVDLVYGRDLHVNHCEGNHMDFSDVELTTPRLNSYHCTYLLHDKTCCGSINATLGILAVIMGVDSQDFEIVTKTLSEKNSRRNKEVVELINNASRLVKCADTFTRELLKAYGTCLTVNVM